MYDNFDSTGDYSGYDYYSIPEYLSIITKEINKEVTLVVKKFFVPYKYIQN